MRACALHASPTQIGSAKKAESVNLGCHWGSEVRAELIQGIVKDLRTRAVFAVIDPAPLTAFHAVHAPSETKALRKFIRYR